jgi:hypothetical protein
MLTRLSGAEVGVAGSKDLLDPLPFMMDTCPILKLNEEDNNKAICKFGHVEVKKWRR